MFGSSSLSAPPNPKPQDLVSFVLCPCPPLLRELYSVIMSHHLFSSLIIVLCLFLVFFYDHHSPFPYITLSPLFCSSLLLLYWDSPSSWLTHILLNNFSLFFYFCSTLFLPSFLLFLYQNTYTLPPTFPLGSPSWCSSLNSLIPDCVFHSLVTTSVRPPTFLYVFSPFPRFIFYFYPCSFALLNSFFIFTPRSSALLTRPYISSYPTLSTLI